MMEVQEYINRIPQANDDELMALLLIRNYLVRVRAICEVAARRFGRPEAMDILEKYVADKRKYVADVTVGDFASAALILLGRGEKAERNEWVSKFVDCGLDMFRDHEKE